MTANPPNAIPINSLSLKDLNSLKQQIEEEATSLTNSLNQIRSIAVRYNESKEALLATTKPENKGRKVMVPVTSSLYVPGELETVDTVLLDIGTGYYIERSPKDGAAFFDRKLALLELQGEKVNQALGQRRKMLENVVMVMNKKLAGGDRKNQA